MRGDCQDTGTSRTENGARREGRAAHPRRRLDGDRGRGYWAVGRATCPVAGAGPAQGGPKRATLRGLWRRAASARVASRVRWSPHGERVDAGATGTESPVGADGVSPWMRRWVWGQRLRPGCCAAWWHLDTDLPLARTAARLRGVDGMAVGAATVRRQDQGRWARVWCALGARRRSAPARTRGAGGADQPRAAGAGGRRRHGPAGGRRLGGGEAGRCGGCPSAATDGLAGWNGRRCSVLCAGCGRHHPGRGAVAAGFWTTAVDALRIRDWAMPVEHLSALAARVFGEQTARSHRALARSTALAVDAGPRRGLGSGAGTRPVPSWRARGPISACGGPPGLPRLSHRGLARGSRRHRGAPHPVMQAHMKRAGMRLGAAARQSDAGLVPARRRCRLGARCCRAATSGAGAAPLRRARPAGRPHPARRARSRRRRPLPARPPAHACPTAPQPPLRSERTPHPRPSAIRRRR